MFYYVLAYPFFRGEYHKFFTNGVKYKRFIFATFEPEGIWRKIQFLHRFKGNQPAEFLGLHQF